MNPQIKSTLQPPPQKVIASKISLKLLIIIAGTIVTLLIAAGLIIMSANNSPVKQMQRLSARFESLQLIVDQGTKSVQNGDLRKVQSDVSILVKGDVASIESAMIAAGLGKVSKELIALESDQSTLNSLTDARLNGRFDSTYKKALAQKLESTMALMREVNNKTSNRTLKMSLSSAYDHFSSLLDQLAKLTL